MATKIVTKNSSTASAVPTASDLVQGELAVNVADKRLFTEDNGGAIVELGTNPSTIDINSGTIDGTAIGASSASTGAFTTLTATGLDVTGTATMDGLTVDGAADIDYQSGATNNTAPDTLKVSNKTTGVHAAGLGASIKFEHTNSSASYSGSRISNVSNADPFTSNLSFYPYNYGYKEAMRISSNGDISFYEDTGTTPKLFWDASAESLGIGTSSPSKPLEITDATADGTGGVKISSYLPTLEMDDISGGGTSFILQHDGTSTLFKHDTTERMRIDSSGNLLVGKTSSSFGTAGVEILPDGRVVAGRAGETLVLNRLTTDGDIALFRKDGTTVGSIGTEGGDLTIGTGDVGLKFNNGASLISPWDTTANAPEDGLFDLGYANGRFKDLYLSGGVYLGGTGSANKLDDYEEGTWTANFYSGINGTGTNVGTKTGNYIKVGNMVTVSYAGAVLTGSPLCVHGLPFTTTDDRLSGVTADGVVAYNNGSSTIINYRSGDGVYSRGTFTYFLH